YSMLHLNTGVRTMESITHESNRRGTLVVEHELGKVYEDNNRFYAWPDDLRGYRWDTLLLATNFLGIKKAVGCADYDGKVKLGRKIESGPDGDIFKHVTTSTSSYMDYVDYYVWPKEGEAMFCLTLSEARE